MEILAFLAVAVIVVLLIVLGIAFVASWVIQSLVGNKKTWLDYGLDEEE